MRILSQVYFWTLLCLIVVTSTPIKAEPLIDTNSSIVTTEHCKTVKVITRAILLDLRNQDIYQAMHLLNQRPMSDFGQDGIVAKTFIQTNLVAYKANVSKGFRNQQILQQVAQLCNNKIGESL